MFRAAVVGVTGFAVAGLSNAADATEYVINGGTLASLPNHKVTIIEIAGADESDRATKEQLRRAGTGMVPDENLKKSSANPKPMKTAIEVKNPAPMPAPQPEAVTPKEPEPAPAAVVDKPVAMAAPLSGPYLRIDTGYGFSMDSDGTQSSGGLTNGSTGDAAFIGGGIGYRLNESVRGDVTFSYRADAGVSATTAAGNTTSSEVNGLSVMANGYWDIAKFDLFTPYVGAGAGYARLSTPTQTTTGGIANEGGASSDNLAWAVMLGGSIAINSEAAFDIGYRFINLGEFKQAATTTYDDLMVHETRAGFRYSF